MKNLLLIGLFLISIAAQSQTIIAQYCLDGNGNDASGNGYDGTAVNVTPATNRFGQVGGALKFDGTSYVILPPMFPIGKAARTVSVWVKIDVDSFFVAKEGWIFSFGTATQSQAFTFGTNISGQNEIELNTSYWNFLATANPGINDKHWHFFTVVIGQSACTTSSVSLKMYLDGTSIYTSCADASKIATSGQSNFIGKSNSTTSPFNFRGLIDDVTIWNGALSDSAILSLYHSTAACEITGIEQLYNNNLSIYPNPSNGTVTIRSGKPATIDVFDLVGQKVFTGKIENEFPLNLKRGIYFLKAENQVRKIVIQ